LDLAARIHERAWQHLGHHWHVPSRQLAGPMSRCYHTDIGQPIWIQKALGGRLAWVALDDLRRNRSGASAEIAMLDYRCPDSAVPLFLEAGEPRQHRELFLPKVQGTTWLDRQFALGSANRGNFWIQGRPLLGYWKGGYAQMRFLKDDYDFTSALLYSVQEKNYLAGLVTFRTPGGDKHPSLDPIRNGEFTATRLRLRLDVAGLDAGSPWLVREDWAAVDAGPVKLWMRIPAAGFGSRTGKLSAGREAGLITVSYDLLPGPSTVKWAETKPAFVFLQLAMEATREDLPHFGARLAATPFRQAAPGAWEWQAPSGTLSLAGSTAPAAIADQDGAFRDGINGKPVPFVRLSEVRLV